MALYNDHLDGIIYKSSFKVSIKDAFISPSGEIILADTFCHCQLAREIIGEKTKNRELNINRMKTEIQRIKEFLNTHDDNNMQYNLNKLESQLNDVLSTTSYEELYNTVNRNKGYDAAEFLVSHLGYIGIEGNYLLYNRKMINSLQTKAINCSFEYCEDGRIITN